MNLKKGEHSTPKKVDSFLMIFFLSSCFYFQTRTDSVLVKFYYNAAFRRFLKTFRKFAGKDFDGNHFQESLSYSEWTQVANTEQKRIPFNDNTVWCKYSRVIKGLSKSGNFILLNAPKYLSARLFCSLYVKTLRIF